MNLTDSPSDALRESITNPSLLSSTELLKQTLRIYKKHALFFTMLCLPLLPLYKIGLDLIVELQKTHSLRGFDGTNLLFFSLLTIITVSFIQSALIIQTTRPMNFFQALLASIKSLPRVVLIMFLSRNVDILFIYLTERVPIKEEAAKSIDYNRPDISARKKFINTILGGAILSIIPAIITYPFGTQTVFLVLYAIFILASAIGFVLRTVYLSLLYTDVQEKYRSIQAVSLTQNILIYQTSSYKLSSFLTNWFTGRTNRKAYLVGTSINLVLICLVAFVGLNGLQNKSYFFVSFVFCFLVTIFSVFYSMSLITRRLQDINKGWFSIMRLIIPFYGVYFFLLLYFKKSVKT